MVRRFLTAEDVRRMGGPSIEVDAATVVTPQAMEAATAMGIAIQATGGGAPRPWTPPTPDRGPDAQRALETLSHLPEPSGGGSESGVIVTVVGKNRSGVLAEITAHLAGAGCNIHKVSQEIIDGYFHLILTVELTGKATFEAAKADLEALGGPDDFVVRAMHERVFRFMHRI
jgi:ACT domain-containing protein